MEQDQGSHKISTFSAMGERLYPDTGSNGREIIRQEIRNIRDSWENLIVRVGDLQKRQDAQMQHWTTYQDSLQQLQQWLDTMEKGVQYEQTNWLSLQETKSRLLKHKGTLQDIVSHKRFIEAANEKGAAVISSNPVAPAEEIQEAIEMINDRYECLLENTKNTVTRMEEAIDGIQQYQDLQKTHQDWQKQMWDKLSVYTEYSGS